MGMDLALLATKILLIIAMVDMASAAEPVTFVFGD